ncbi:MAG: MFS transporter [Candidatus Latescibacterota bacterium]
MTPHGFSPTAGTLGNPAYRRLMASTLVSYGARFLDATMLSWLVVQRTEDPLPVALLSFFGFVPFLAMGPSAGLVADRLPRLRVMRWAQAGLAGLAVAMAGLLFAGALEVWHAYAYALCQGLLLVLDSTSRRTYMAGTVGRAHVTAAVSLDMLGMTVARILFANAGGALLGASRPRWAYLVLAGMALASALLTRGLPPLFAGGRDSHRESLLTAVKGGLRFARENRLVLGGLMLVALANLTAFAYEPMVPAVADDVFHVSPALFGLFLSATSIGSLATSLWLALGGKRLARPGLTGLVAAAGLHGLQIAFSYADTVGPSLALLAAIGAVGMVFSISHSSLFLVAAPDALRGRVLGLQTLMIGAYPLCTLAVGWLGNKLGALAAVRMVALAGVVWVVALAALVPELRQRVGRRDGVGEPEAA